MLRYHCSSPSELTPREWQAWEQIQRDEPSLASPYFHPEFTRAVAAVRDDVRIGVISAGEAPVGFFPFQQSGWGVGAPVGGRLSDFHGAIVRGDVSWQVGELLAACNLSAWDFHHLLADQKPFEKHHHLTEISPYLDLSAGFDAYCKAKAHETDEVKQTLRKRRKCERELGPLRFEWHTDDEAILSQLISWKEQQYAAAGYTNLFEFDWTRGLVRELLARRGDDFGALLSTLHLGDRLMAIHYGLRCRGVLHSWFPGYDRELHTWSPGRLLLMTLAERSADLGIVRIDLGRGTEQFKVSFGSASDLVAEGSAEDRSAVTMMRQAWRSTRRWVRESPVWAAAQYPAAWTRSFRDWLSFR